MDHKSMTEPLKWFDQTSGNQSKEGDWGGGGPKELDYY